MIIILCCKSNNEYKFIMYYLQTGHHKIYLIRWQLFCVVKSNSECKNVYNVILTNYKKKDKFV